MLYPVCAGGRAGICWLMLGFVLGLSPASRASWQTNIFSTGFELAEGYSLDYDLDEQQDWTGTALDSWGENGLVEEMFPGYGQQAYLGYSLQATNAAYYSVWKPINLAPIPTNLLSVQFSVLMSIEDSSNERYDDFRWSVYNTAGQRLFTLDFDNSNFHINYALENRSTFEFTGRAFQLSTIYELIILMDFAHNRWSATLDGEWLATNQPITTTNSALNLGDIDAVWYLREVGQPGDNYMLFDDYQIVANLPPPQAPRLELYGLAAAGSLFYGRVTGEPGRSYAVEFSPDLSAWTPFVTNVSNPGGYFDFLDWGGHGTNRCFYRARVVP